MPVRNPFLMSEEMYLIVIKAIAHYGHNPESRIAKRFGLPAINKVNTQVRLF
jgi:hypothetical protein